VRRLWLRNLSPYRDKKAYDLLVQCEAGLVSITGTPETPSKAGIAVADFAAGMYAYSNILAALFRRERTDEGVAIEVSLFEALADWMGFPPTTPYTGREPARRGTSHASMASYGPFMCAGSETVFLDIENDGSVRDSARSSSSVLGRQKTRASRATRTGSPTGTLWTRRSRRPSGALPPQEQ